MGRLTLCLFASLVIGNLVIVSSTGLPCASGLDCVDVTCEADIEPSCDEGTCVCKDEDPNGIDDFTSQSQQYIEQLLRNIKIYRQMHFTWITDAPTSPENSKPTLHFPKKRSIGQMNRAVAKQKTVNVLGAKKRVERSAPPPPIVDIVLDSNFGKPSLCGINETNERETQAWLYTVQQLSLYPPPMDEDTFFSKWKEVIRPFSKDIITRSQFSRSFPKIPDRNAITVVSTSDAFQKIFWPFVYEIGFMNQKLGLFGLTGEEVDESMQKSEFFAVLEKEQTIKIPYAADKLVYSFDDEELVMGLVNSGVIKYTKEFFDAGSYKFDVVKQKEIAEKVDAAMDLIKETMPELHKSIIQLVGCLAFYKAEDRSHIGGTGSSALGVLWLDPSADVNWSVPYYAEQIIHEYIHTTLFYAELVHGTYTEFDNIALAQTMSTIRKELRAFDKSFHAAYVSVGMLAFHARAGFWERAENLAVPIPSALEELITVNDIYEVLTPAGIDLLQSMVDFMTAIRLMD